MTEDHRKPPTDDPAASLVERLQQQTRLHREALAERAELHRRFLALQARAATLLPRLTAQPAPAPDPAPPSAPPIQEPARPPAPAPASPSAVPPVMIVPSSPPLPTDSATWPAATAAFLAPAPAPTPAPASAAPPAPPAMPAPAPPARTAAPAPEDATQPGRHRDEHTSGLHRAPLRTSRHRRNTTAFTNPIVVVRPPVPTEPRGLSLRPLEVAPHAPADTTHETLLRSFLPTSADRPAFGSIAGLHRDLGKGEASVWADLHIPDDAPFLVQRRLPLDLVLTTFDIARALRQGLPSTDDEGSPLLAARLMSHAPSPIAGETVRLEAHLRASTAGPQLESIAFHDGAPLLSWHDVPAPDALPTANPPLQAEPWRPPRRSGRERFDHDALLAFAEGRLLDAGGPGFELGASHRCTAHLPTAPNLLLQQLDHFDPGSALAPAGRLDALLIDGLDNPFALVAAGIQAAFAYLLACGYSLDRDAWNLDLVPFRPIDVVWSPAALRGPGQTLAQLLLRDHGDLPCPALMADLVVTRLGQPILVAKGLTVQLAPNWPTASLPPEPPAPASADDFPTRALHLTDRARPTDAFGPLYAPFDGPRYLARPPGGRLLLASRVLAHTGHVGVLAPGDALQTELDLDPGAWYFAASSPGAMPPTALLEAALWPCRYLAILGGVPLRNERDLYARPTEGTLTQHIAITPALGKLRVRAVVRAVTENPERALLDFDVVVTSPGGAPLATLEIAIGYYVAGLLAQTSSLPTLTPPEGPGLVDVALLDDQATGLPAAPVRLIDRILAAWNDGGSAGLGRLRAQLALPPDAWCFRDHTFQDPTLPTSLAIEAMLQLLRLAGARKGWQPLNAALDETLRWRTTGHAAPGDLAPWIELDITARRDLADEIIASARAWLFVGDRAILHVENLALRFGREELADLPQAEVVSPDILDPARQRWLQDYRPTDALPALPMTVAADLLAAAAHQSRPEHVVFRLERMVMSRWIVFATPLRAMTRVDLVRGRRSAVVASLAVHPPDLPNDAEWDEVATARMLLAPSYGPCRDELPPLTDVQPMPSPYDELFQGPAFHLLTRAEVGREGARAVLDLDRCAVPPGELHPAVLDAALHVVTAASLRRWADDVDRDMAAYPTKIEVATFHGPPPTSGEVQVELRFDGFRAGPRFPAVRVHLSHDGKIWATLLVVLVLVSRGRLRSLDANVRHSFVRNRQFVPGIGLSSFDGPVTHIRMADVQVADWLDGTVSWLYHASGDLETLTRKVVVKDHVAQQLGVHPSAIDVSLDSGWATCVARPLCCYPFRTRRELMGFSAETTGPIRLDPSPLMLRWRTVYQLPDRWLGEDLYRGLLRHLVHEVVLPSTDAATRLDGARTLFVVTSSHPLAPLLWHATLPTFTGRDPIHVGPLPAGLDELVETLEAFSPGQFPTLRAADATLPSLFLRATTEPLNLVVHLDGPSARPDARAWVEAARDAGFLIVPLAIHADLTPLRPAVLRLGEPIADPRTDPDAVLVSTARLASVNDAPGLPPIPLAAEAATWSDARGVTPENALIFKTLQNTPAPGDDTRRIIESIAAGHFAATGSSHDAWLARWIVALGGPDVEITPTD